MPSSRCGTILSFKYTRAGAPPGRTCVADAFEKSAIGVLEPAPLASAIAVDCFGGGGGGAASAGGAEAGGGPVEGAVFDCI